MLALDQAIFTRWNATGLNISVGLISDHQIPEATDLRAGTGFYCSFENVSDEKTAQTVRSRYQKAMVQFALYGLSKVPVAAACELIQNAFLNANLSTTNPLVLADADGIVSCICIAPYTMNQVSDTVWCGSQTFAIEYRRPGYLP